MSSEFGVRGRVKVCNSSLMAAAHLLSITPPYLILHHNSTSLSCNPANTTHTSTNLRQNHQHLLKLISHALLSPPISSIIHQSNPNCYNNSSRTTTTQTKPVSTTQPHQPNPHQSPTNFTPDPQLIKPPIDPKIRTISNLIKFEHTVGGSTELRVRDFGGFVIRRGVVEHTLGSTEPTP